MKWNVIVKDLSTGRIGPYNIFDCADFRIAVEKTIAQKYDKTRFLEELDREADYCFRAQIEWETFFTTWPPYIGAEEINRIIKEFYLNVYAQLRANWERFSDYVWKEGQK